MVKITSESWVEKDDSMFTGRFQVHSIKKKVSRKKKENNNKIKKFFLTNKTILSIAISKLVTVWQFLL